MELTFQTTERELKTVDVKIQVPCHRYEQVGNRYHFINEQGELITVGMHSVIYWPAEYDCTKEQINKVLTNSHACIEADFKDALDKVLFQVQEMYTK